MKEDKSKYYVIIGIIQLMTIITFLTITYFMFKKESIILNPIPYTIGLGAVIIIIDFIILSVIFKKHDIKEMSENIEGL